MRGGKNTKYLGGIGIPELDMVIEGGSDEEAGVNWIPDGTRDGKFVSIEVKEAVMLRNQPSGFIVCCLLHVKNSSASVRCSREQIPSLCHIDLPNFLYVCVSK